MSSSTSISISPKIWQQEANELDAILTPVLSSEERPLPEQVLSEEDLDREAHIEDDNKILQEALSSKSPERLAGTIGALHENSRVRRDINIGRASHKRLIYGSLSTIYSRRQHLEWLLNN